MTTRQQYYLFKEIIRKMEREGQHDITHEVGHSLQGKQRSIWFSALYAYPVRLIFTPAHIRWNGRVWCQRKW